MKCRALCLYLFFALVSTLASAQAPSSPALRPADVIDVVVLGQPTLSGNFVVEKDGFIVYPLIGRVEVAGLGPDEVAKRLQAKLSGDFIRRPEVSVRVKEYRSRPILIMGEVANPGIHFLTGDRSLLVMLKAAGGLSSNAGHELVIARPPEGSEALAIEQYSSMLVVPGLNDVARLPGTEELPPGAIDGSDIFRASFKELLKGNAEQNAILESGDLVYVPRAAQIFVTGQAARPSNLKFVEGMTVQDALQLVGGASERGSMRRLKIIRFEAGKRKEVKAQLTDLLKPGDTLHIGERFF